MDVTIGSRTFRSTKMDPFKQIHVIRRMGSLFPSVAGAVRVPDKMLAAGYIGAALGRLSDDDANFILNSCLATCQLKQGTMWASVVDANGTLMFQDMQLPEILELVWKVLEDNFRPFIKDLLAKVSSAEVSA